MLHEVRLTRAGQQHMRELQQAYALVCLMTRDADPLTEGRSLWAQPRRDLLIIKAEAFDAAPGVVAEHRAKPIPPTPPEGATVRLAMIGHPVKRRSTTGNNGRRRIRENVLDHQASIDWFTARLADCVDLKDVAVEDMGNRRGRRWSPRGHLPLVLRWHGYTAVGVVTDQARLLAKQRDGIGDSKAYGCGLLLVTSS